MGRSGLVRVVRLTGWVTDDAYDGPHKERSIRMWMCGRDRQGDRKRENQEV